MECANGDIAVAVWLMGVPFVGRGGGMWYITIRTIWEVKHALSTEC